jgi:hypothetical protein
LRKKVYMNVCLILNDYRGRTTKSHSLDFCLWGWMKSKVNKRKVSTRDEFVACILDAAAHIKNCEDQYRRTTRGLRPQVAKCIVAGGEIFEYFFVVVTNLSFMCNKFFI